MEQEPKIEQSQDDSKERRVGALAERIKQEVSGVLWQVARGEIDDEAGKKKIHEVIESLLTMLPFLDK